MTFITITRPAKHPEPTDLGPMTEFKPACNFCGEPATDGAVVCWQPGEGQPFAVCSRCDDGRTFGFCSLDAVEFFARLNLKP